MTSSHQIHTSLSSLLPTLHPLPQPLIELSASLLAQSRSRASNLKPEEEIARTYACCHIACERLGKKLGLEIGKPMPPCPPRVYSRLKGWLGSALKTAGVGTPRKGDGAATPKSGKGIEADVGRGSGVKRKVGEVEDEAEMETPSKRAEKRVRTPRSGRAALRDVVEASEAEVEDGDEEQAEDGDEVMQANAAKTAPKQRPARTPLRRKEKHAKRSVQEDAAGAAGLLPGLGTMFQPAIDWLSEDRRAQYRMWEKDVRREMAVLAKQAV